MIQNDDEMDGKIGSIKTEVTQIDEDTYGVQTTIKVSVLFVIGVIALCLAVAFFFLYRG